MRSSAISLFALRFCWFSLISGVQAIPSRINRVDVPSRSLRYDIRSILPRAITVDPDHSQKIQRDILSLASEPIVSHEKTIFLTPPIIITLILFLTFAAGLIAVFFYGHEIRAFLQRLWKRNRKVPVAVDAEEETGLGFGYDSPTEAEVEALKWREEKKTVRGPFWRCLDRLSLPARPPAASPKQLFLPPVTLDDEKITLEDLKVDETHVGIATQLAGTRILDAPGECEGSRSDSNHNAIHVVDR